MKGLTTLSFLALLYLIIIILFHEVVGEPRGVESQGEKNIGQPPDSGVSSATTYHPIVDGKSGRNGTINATQVPTLNDVIFGHVATKHLPQQKVSQESSSEAQVDGKPSLRATDDNGFDQKNETNPLADLFQITDPTTRAALSAIYGAYKGNDQCSRKAFCMMGNYMKDMPARDLIFYLMGGYVPPDYGLYYEIFKAGVIYGQNCQVYVCVPDAKASPVKEAASSAEPKTNNVDNNLNSIPR